MPANRITAAVEAGLISPAGRAGNHKHAPVIFSREDLPRLKDALLGGISIKACAHGNPHQCKSAADVRAKHGAIIRAAREAGK